MSLVTVIIPYREGEPVGKPPEGVETFWIDSGLGIGEARIKGALRASTLWLVQCDADAYYPDDYITRIEAAIRSGRYLYGFWCKREGGIVPAWLESGLVVRRDVFLERTKDFKPDKGADVGKEFWDLPIAYNITYRHGLIDNERRTILLFLIILFSA